MERMISRASGILDPASFPKQFDEDIDVESGRQTDAPVPLEGNETALEHSLSLVAKVPSKPIKAIPNGGIKAWLQVLGVFFITFNTWGLTNAYGVFESFYSSGYIDSSVANISIVGAIEIFFLLAASLVAGPLFDKGYFYHMLVFGAVLTVFGMMMTSLCKEYYQILLAQGLCVGIGCGCLFINAIAVIPTYFTTKKLLATGLGMAGGAVGGIVYPVMFFYLQPQVGYPWAIRIIGFTIMATLAISLAVLRVRMSTGGAKKKRFDLTVFGDAAFMLYTIGLFTGYIGIFIPFFYVSSFAVENLQASPALALSYLLILNATSVLGRIVPGYIADRIGPLNVTAPSAIICTVLLWCWIPDNSTGGLFPFVLLYGFFSGAYVSIPPMAVVSLSPTLDSIGARMGMVFTCAGAGVLLGQPVAGTILASTNSYLGLQAWAAAAVTVSAVLMLSARAVKAGLAIRVKA